MKKKVAVAVAILILVSSVIAIATYSTVYTDGNIFNIVDNTSVGPRHDYTGGATINFYDMDDTKYNDITGDYRPVYDNLTDEEYNWVFGDLPVFPDDFFDVVKLVYEGKFVKYEELGEQYYKQPEFYTGWFNVYTHWYPENRPDMWAVEGYSFFPLIKEITTKKGNTIQSTIYFRTNYGIETYQGMIIRPYLPTVAKNMLGNDIFTQLENAGDYIKASIVNADDGLYQQFKNKLTYDNVDDSDWLVILKPTYTALNDKYGNFVSYKGFYNDWVRLLTLQVTISDNTPSGEYVVALEVVPPCFEINQEYYFSVEHEYYGMYYHPVSQIVQSNIPSFQLVIKVE